MNYLCPVCGYDRLTHAPQDDMICPCCGTHFGYDDFEVSNEELRVRWIRDGALWFSRGTPPPQGWNAWTQLLTIESVCRFESRESKSEFLKVSFFAPQVIPGAVTITTASLTRHVRA